MKSGSMSFHIDIPSDIEERLRTEAHRVGLDPTKVALDALRTALPPTGPKLSPKELIAIWRKDGVLGTFSDRPDSPQFACELRHIAEQR